MKNGRQQPSFLAQTVNREENEDLVAWACDTLGAELVEIPTDPAWNIAGDTTGRNLPVYHFFPHRTEGEGLFLALLRKKKGEMFNDRRKLQIPLDAREGNGRKRGAKSSVKPNTTLLSWLENAEDFTFQCSVDGVWTAIPTRFAEIREQLANVAPLLLASRLEQKRVKNSSLNTHSPCPLLPHLPPFHVWR